MSDYIGILMGGYLDESDRPMDRPELNKRIKRLESALIEGIKSE